jgi:hypothetical protein
MADADHSADDQLRRECRKPLQVGQTGRVDCEHRRTGSAQGSNRGLGVPGRHLLGDTGDDVLRHVVDLGKEAAQQIGVVGRQE